MKRDLLLCNTPRERDECEQQRERDEELRQLDREEDERERGYSLRSVSFQDTAPASRQDA